MENRKAFKARKEAALDAAQKQGIVDVVTAGNSGGVSPETVELAASLMEKHREGAYKRLGARLGTQ